MTVRVTGESITQREKGRVSDLQRQKRYRNQRHHEKDAIIPSVPLKQNSNNESYYFRHELCAVWECGFGLEKLHTSSAEQSRASAFTCTFSSVT